MSDHEAVHRVRAFASPAHAATYLWALANKDSRPWSSVESLKESGRAIRALRGEAADDEGWFQCIPTKESFSVSTRFILLRLDSLKLVTVNCLSSGCSTGPALLFGAPGIEPTDEDSEDSNRAHTTAEEEVLHDVQEDMLTMMKEAVQVIEPYFSLHSMKRYALFGLQATCKDHMPVYPVARILVMTPLSFSHLCIGASLRAHPCKSTHQFSEVLWLRRASTDHPAAAPVMEPYANAIYSRAEGDDASRTESQSEDSSDDDLEEYDPLAPVAPTVQESTDGLPVMKAWNTEWQDPMSMASSYSDAAHELQQAYGATLRPPAAREWQDPQSMVPSLVDEARNLQQTQDSMRRQPLAGDCQDPQSMALSASDKGGSIHQLHSSTQRTLSSHTVTFGEPQMTTGTDVSEPQALDGQRSLRQVDSNTTQHPATTLRSLFSALGMQSPKESTSGTSHTPLTMMSGQDDRLHPASSQLRDLPMTMDMRPSSDDGHYRPDATQPSTYDDYPQHGWRRASRSSFGGKAPSLPTVDEESGESDCDLSEDLDNMAVSSADAHPLDTEEAGTLVRTSAGSNVETCEDTQHLNMPPLDQRGVGNEVQDVVACLTFGDKHPKTMTDSPHHAAEGNNQSASADLSKFLSITTLQCFVQRKEEQYGSVQSLMQTLKGPARTPRWHKENSAEPQSTRCAPSIRILYAQSEIWSGQNHCCVSPASTESFPMGQ
jgi:hypothetical protein